MELPPHPAEDDTPVTKASSWRIKAVIAVVVALVGLVVLLHLTGVIGGGRH